MHALSSCEDPIKSIFHFNLNPTQHAVNMILTCLTLQAVWIKTKEATLCFSSSIIFSTWSKKRYLHDSI